MTAKQPNGFRRVEVFSASGGVGKTLLAIRLAELQAKRTDAPVLLVDADVSGPCLGDLLESWVSPPWDSTDTLIHLICGRPEYLPELLRPGKLPVYRLRESCPAAIEARRPAAVTAAVRGGAVLFCPSHARNPRVDKVVLNALLGHESAGGWIGYVIEQVIRATSRLMNGRLGGVVVDHSGTMGALQEAALLACAEPDGAADGDRRALIVTTSGTSALAAARDLAGHLAVLSPEIRRRSRDAADLTERIVWVVNRLKPSEADWKEDIKKRFPRNDAWLERALPVRSDDALAEAPKGANLNRSAASDDDFEEVRKAIFE